MKIRKNQYQYFDVRHSLQGYGDREFIGHDWLNYLNDNSVRYHIRFRNNFKVYCFDKNQEKPAFWLFNRLKINEFSHHPKIVRMNGVMCCVSGLKVSDKDGETDFLILVSFNNPQNILDYYRKRWEVETLFQWETTSHTEAKEIKIKKHKRRAVSIFKYGLG